MNPRRAGMPPPSSTRGLVVTSSHGPGPGQENFSVILELSLANGDPVSGTVGVLGGAPATPFHGWIDLMSTINRLRANAGSSP
jgi:hypothetical protein